VLKAIASSMRKKRAGESGFTLIELLVVIVILGVLAAVVVFAVQGTGDKGKAASYAIDERTIRTAEEAYRAKNGVFGTEQELIDAQLLSAQSSIHDVVLSPDKLSYVMPFQPQAGVPGGTLVVGESFAIPATRNPAMDTNGSTHAFWESMYNGLLTLDERGNPQPELAVRVPTVANGDIRDGGFGLGSTYRLKLRNDVFWHDSGVNTGSGGSNPTGAVQQFTADDVKFTFEKALLRSHARAKNMILALVSYDQTANNFVASIDRCAGAEVDDLAGDPTQQFCVAFHFNSPYAPFLKQLNVTEAPMAPKHAFCQATQTACVGPTTSTPTTAALQASSVGTGPFRCTFPYTTPTPCRNGNGSPDAMIEKNPSYWRTGFPYLDKIVMRDFSASGNTRTDALISGGVDWVWDVLETRATEVAGKSNLKTAATQSLGGGPNSIDQLIFNLWDQTATATTPGGATGTINAGTANPHPVFGDTGSLIDPDGSGPEPAMNRGQLVRKAISYAVDRNAYLATRGNVGTVASAPISSELPSHANDITLPAFNQSKAAALLDAAGWTYTSPNPYRKWSGATGGGLTNGQDLAFQFVCGSVPLCARVDTVATQLLALNINLQKVDCSGTGGAPSCNSGGYTSTNDRVFTKRDWDMYIINFAQGYDPHIGVRRQFHSDQITDATGAVPNNAPGYKNAVVDAAFTNAVTTLDTNARNSYYHEFQAQAAKDFPYVWVIETPNVRGYTSSCAGFRAFTGLFAEFASCRR
jgi:prepilin-type N-terminal cleavage/methylation domain-containing protein